MKIIILGAGRVGYSVAESLVSERNDITVIDHAAAIHHDQHVLLDAQRIRHGRIESSTQQGPAPARVSAIHHGNAAPCLTWP